MEERPRFQSLILYLLAVWPWPSSLAFLSLLSCLCAGDTAVTGDLCKQQMRDVLFPTCRCYPVNGGCFRCFHHQVLRKQVLHSFPEVMFKCSLVTRKHRKQTYGYQGGKGGCKLGIWDELIHSTVYKIDDQQEPTVQPRELDAIFFFGLLSF